MIKFLVDCPAAYLTEKRILIVADMHLGIEHALFKSGIVISAQAEKFQKILDSMIRQTKAKTLIILGDLKYEVPGISLREEREIPKLFNHLNEKVGLILCRGNHDTELKGLLPEEMKVYDSKGLKIGKYGFFHGHAWPSKELMQCDYLFMGHLQPAVGFRDKFGYRSVQQVWLRGKLNQKLVKKKYKINKTGGLNIIVAPAFNKFSGSLVVNRVLKKDLVGPLFNSKILNVNEMSAYLLDGTYLGRVRKI
jgi:putative SbcD/Mre11-related phosphoesterase